MSMFSPIQSSSGSPVIIVKPTTRGYTVICNDEACRRSVNPVAKEVYGTIVKVREFFLENFDRWGLDGQGSMIPIVIHWDEKNAQWACKAGSCILRFHDIYALTPEVVAHEYMHAVINELNPLKYSKQSGALNESLADVMGIAFKHWLTGKTDWRIGRLRNISQHASMKNFLNTRKDAGGVHTNSAIPNHAFYKAATEVGSVNLVALVWFQAFQEVSYTASFKEFAKKTIQVSQRANLPRSVTIDILAAWQTVGVLDVTVVEERYKEFWDTVNMVPVIIKEPIYSYA